MIILSLRGGDDFLEQTFTDALPPEPGIHVNGMLDSIFVSWKRAKRPVAPEAHKPAGIVLNADDRIISFRLGLEPGRHHFLRARFVIIKRGGIEDGLIEDSQNGISMAITGALDDSHGRAISAALTSP